MAKRCDGHPAARRLGLDVDDLASEFTLAVLRAKDRYDPSRGAWSTFATWQMKGRWSQIRERARRRPLLLHAEHEAPAPAAGDPLDLSPLNDRQRRLIEMRGAGFTYEEAGAAVGVSKQAAREATVQAARLLT
jgi:DNA-directed RNA polymerase specialized sigma24 family protein